MVMATLEYSEIKDFIDLYDKAVENNDKYFQFKGELVLVTYAKYLIEYLTSINK